MTTTLLSTKPTFSVADELAVDLTKVPMGANLINGGVAFRTWAPRAEEVHVVGPFNEWTRSENTLLHQIGEGHWAGFFPNLKKNEEYLFYIVGQGQSSFKRDPYARDLTFQPPFPFCNCLIENPRKFSWHDLNFTPPAFSDLIIYQFHVGTFYIQEQRNEGKFLDVILQLEHLVELGVNAIQPLPIVEFPTEFSFGYNGTDYFSPESDYAVSDLNQLQVYLNEINRLLIAKQQPAYEMADIMTQSNQLRALVDVCHVYQIAVIFDVVYNHAGGGFDANSIFFYDNRPRGNNNESLFFTDQGWAGGLVFAFWNRNVRQFLIDNAKFLIDEYHIDGFRYDEVSVIDRFGGWNFCQDLSSTCRYIKPQAIQIAEYWPVNPYAIAPTANGGAGFDTIWSDQIRESIRKAVSQASYGESAPINMDMIAAALRTEGFANAWQTVQYVESHDEIKLGSGERIPKLADPSNPRSWYARSRSRFALGVLMTAPGIPMLFMGQEFLENKQWSDNPDQPNLISWEDIKREKTSGDFLRFTKDLIHLRKSYQAFRQSSINVFHIHNDNRIIAFHRWVEGIGDDVVVVASLHEFPYRNYQLGFPLRGAWKEVFNSDYYEGFPNANPIGNQGEIFADGFDMHGLPGSAAIQIPANGILIFARNRS